MDKTKQRVSKSAAFAAGVGAAAAAAAAAYWLYGTKDAARNRKLARSWMLKARADVMEAVEKAVEKAGEIDKDAYMKIVKGVLKRYSKVAGVTGAQVVDMTADMKDAWMRMQQSRTGTRKTSKKRR